MRSLATEPVGERVEPVASGDRLRTAIAFPASNRRGGVERVVYESARYLSRRGHDVTVLAESWDPDGTGRTRYHRVEMGRLLGMLPRPGFLRGPAFRSACGRALVSASDPASGGPFDIVTCHGCVSPMGHLHWAHSIHGAWLEVARRFRKPWSWDAIKQRINPAHRVLLGLEREHFAGRHYRHVIALTEESAADLGRLYGVPRGDITLIAPGYSPEDFHTRGHGERRSGMRARLGLRDSDRLVLFVANELLRKGFGPLLEAVSRVRTPGVRVAIVGNTSPGPFRSMIDRLGLSGRLDWLGRVSEEDLTACYAASDVFCLPSQYEGWGLVVVEALACGLPVVTTQATRASVVMTDPAMGRVVESPEDVAALAAALDEVFLQGPPDREAVSEAVAPWRWDSVLPRYEALLQHLAGRGAAAVT